MTTHAIHKTKVKIIHFFNRVKVMNKTTKKLEQAEKAEITVKLEETEKLKLQYANNIQTTTTTQINNIHKSDTDLSENHQPLQTKSPTIANAKPNLYTIISTNTNTKPS